jgi:Lamin Tail Domain
MKLQRTHALVLATTLFAAALPAHADILVTEVSPYSSGNAAFAADWFELTNTGNSAVSVSGWKVDDSSNSAATAIALSGITSIGAGESVIFLEGTASTVTGFLSHWFGASAPASLQVGTYSGAGIGLSTGGDAINIFNGADARIAGVAFGTATIGRTFDNAAGLNSLTLPLPLVGNLSAVGVNGAFNSVAALSTGVPLGTLDIGSPGVAAAVPEVSTYAMMLTGLFGVALLRRRRS